MTPAHVYITQKGEGKAKTLRGILEALRLLDGDATMSNAAALYDALVEHGRAYIGAIDLDDLSVFDARMEAGEFGVAFTVEPAQDDDPAPAIPDDLDMGRAFSAGMILLHALDGNPTYALQIAQGFRRVLDDPFWDHVAAALLAVFPAQSRPTP